MTQVATHCVADELLADGSIQRTDEQATGETDDAETSDSTLDAGAAEDPVMEKEDGDVEGKEVDVESKDGAVEQGEGALLDARAAGGETEPDLDASSGQEDMSTAEAGAPGADAEPAGAEALTCSEGARGAWRRFQMSEAMVPEIVACVSQDVSCRSSACDIAPCLMQSAQVVGCQECVAAEVACGARSCAVPCATATDDDACRACLCANHCMDAPAGCGVGTPSACGDCTGASCSARFASTTDTITVPLFFHLLHDRVEATTGLPAYTNRAGAVETIFDIDARLAQINSALTAASPDARRLRVIRAGVAYDVASTAGACPDPVAASDARRVFGALNLVLTREQAACPALASSAFAGRAEGASLLRTLGNLLGIPPAEQTSQEWQITPQQFLRMHNYTRWRLAAADAVPEAERASSVSFLHGPADPIWDKLTNRNWALSNASVFEASAPGPFSSSPAVADFTVPTTRAARRVLGVRVRARISGTPSQNLELVVSGPRFAPASIPRTAISIQDGLLVAEEAFDTSSSLAWHQHRNGIAARLWRVAFTNIGDLTLRDIQLELVLGDRYFSRYDRHARGVTDILTYRPSESALLSATNPANRTFRFGANVSDAVPALPVQNAEVTSGDVDGDGQVDLLARRGSSIWVSFYRRSFTPWRAGTIAGTPPAGSDDVLIGDFDGDGFGDLMRRRTDLGTSTSTWGFHRGVGDGTFEAARNPTFAGNPLPAHVHWTVADFQRAGFSDILFREHANGVMAVSVNHTLRPTTSGTTPNFYGAYNPSISGAYTMLPVSDRFIVLDANADGQDDMVSRRAGSGEWFVYLNQGRETFSAAQPLTIGASQSAFSDTDTLVGSTPSATLHRWIKAGSPDFPGLSAAFAGGNQPDGTLQYVCRASLQGGLQIGKWVANQCNIPWGGGEYQISSNAEILLGPGLIWGGGGPAIVGGMESDGRTMIGVCRAMHAGGLHVGKVVNGGCWIAFSGTEIYKSPYTLLTAE